MSKFKERSDMSYKPDWLSFQSEVADKFDENFVNIKYDCSKDLEYLKNLYMKDKSIRPNMMLIRDKLTTFIEQGAKYRGTSFVNIVGEYLTGAVPANSDLGALNQRCKLQDAYAKALGSGLAETLKQRGFTANDRGRYPNYDLAKLAIELESLSSKGPYDNGTDELSFTVEANNMIDANVGDATLDSYAMESFIKGLDKRRNLYLSSGLIDENMAFEPWRFAELAIQNHIQTTFRGGPNCSGDSIVTMSIINYYRKVFVNSMFKFLNIFKVKKPDHIALYYTVTETIKYPDASLFNRKKASKISQAICNYIDENYVANSDESVAFRKKRGIIKALNIDPNSPDYYKKTGELNIVRVMNHDELLSDIWKQVFKDKSLSAKEVLSNLSPLVRCQVVLTRDQGSPYLYDYKSRDIKVKDERKARKWRMVTPMNVVIQSLDICAGLQLVKSATSIPGRIGLKDPDTNFKLMQSYLKSSFDHGCYNEPLDMTRFDAGITDQLVNLLGLMYASLYNNPNIKYILATSGWYAMDKFIFMAKPDKNIDPIWDVYPNIAIPNIMSKRDKAAMKAATSNDPRLVRRAQRVLEGSKETYGTCHLVHFSRSWYPSGLIFTNSGESDINCSVQSDVLPRLLLQHQEVKAIPELVECITNGLDNGIFQAQTSGDDVLTTVPLLMHKYFSREDILRIIAECLATINWTLNWKKMSNVTYKIVHEGEEYYIPVAEFLQILWFQNPENGTEPGRRKFMRMLPSMPYRERNFKLPNIMQYTSIDGRFSTALTENEFDMDFAAEVLIRSGQIHKELVNRSRLRINRTKGVMEYIKNKDYVQYNAGCEAGTSALLSLDDYFGYVKQYGDDLNAAIAHYVSTVKIDKILNIYNGLSQELETRAPHKKGLMKKFLSAYSEEEIKFLFGNLDLDDMDQYKPMSPILLKAIEKNGVTIPSKALPGPEQISVEDDVPGEELDA